MVDIHSHVVPDIDDGSTSLEMSIQMLKRAYAQGVTDIFCTSHSYYIDNNTYKYMDKFKAFKKKVFLEVPNIKLYSGCELLCSVHDMERIIAKLKSGDYNTLNQRNVVLVECYTDVVPTEAIYIAHSLLQAEYTPIFAHVERYPYLFDGITIDKLINMGCMIQVNTYSFAEAKNSSMGMRAEELLNNKQIHFLGSDAHNITWRPPMIKSGLEYIREHTDRDYYETICYKNAQKYLIN